MTYLCLAVHFGECNKSSPRRAKDILLDSKALHRVSFPLSLGHYMQLLTSYILNTVTTVDFYSGIFSSLSPSLPSLSPPLVSLQSAAWAAAREAPGSWGHARRDGAHPHRHAGGGPDPAGPVEAETQPLLQRESLIRDFASSGMVVFITNQ